MKQNILLLVLLCCASVKTVCGQLLDGRIVDADQNALANVLVTLYSSTDTLKAKYRTTTDQNGSFSFAQLPVSTYRLQAACIGHKRFSTSVSMGNQAVHLGTIQMETTWRALPTIVVKADYIQQKGNKTVYRIPPLTAKRARSAFELMSVVPEIQVNPVNLSIKYANANAVLFLINDIPATEAEFRAIPAQDVKKIETYDTPPARYMEYDKVVNVITYARTKGYAAGGLAEQSISPTRGYTNGWAYGVYNKGKNSWIMQYNYMRRRFTQQFGTDHYQFALPSDNVDYLRDKHGYKNINNHEPSLFYIYDDAHKQKLQIVLQPNYLHTYNSFTSDITLNHTTKLKGMGHDKTTMFYPSLNLFHRYYFSPDQYLSSNLVLTNFNVWQDYRNKEWKPTDGTQYFLDEMSQHTYKYSAIAEADFTHIKGKNVYEVGIRYTGSFLNTFIKDRNSDSKYKSGQSLFELYGDYVRQLKHWTLVGRMGLGYVYSHAYDAYLTNWSPQADLSTYYQITSHHKMSFKVAYSYDAPALGLRTNNTRYIISGLRYTGNPYLKGTNKATLSMDYTLNYNRFFVTISPVLTQEWKPIFYNYLLEGNEMLQRPENAKTLTTAALQYALRYSPFAKELFTFSINGSLKHHSLNPVSMPHITYFETPIHYQIDFNLGHFSAFYQGTLFRQYMSGLIVQAGDVTSNIGVKYRIKNYTLQLNGVWFLTKPDLWKRTHQASLLQQHSNFTIKDQSTVITLGISIDLSSGNSNSSADTLDNKDNDSGAF